MKEIKDDTNRKISHVLGLEELILSKELCYVLCKTIYRFNAIPVKSPMAFFTKLEKIFKGHMEIQKAPNSQNNIEREKNKGAGRIRLPDLRLYYKVEVKDYGTGTKTEI